MDKMAHMEESKIEDILLERSLQLFKEYEGIRTRLKSTIERINGPYYSEHGLEHCNNILKSINLIVPPNIKYEMKINELFCLLCSILLHDIGRISQNRPYELLRETNRDHAHRSFDWIMENGERILGLDMPYIKPVAWICWGHGDVEGVETQIKRTFKDCMVPIENEEMDILFLISLLRLGDVLDIGFRRIPKPLIDSLWEIPDSEIKFILKDYLTNAVIIDSKKRRIKITLRRPSNLDAAIFSEIETNLIKNKCEEVLNSAMEHLEHKDIYFKPIDVQTIEGGPEEIIERLLRREVTEETYTEMDKGYREATNKGEVIPVYSKSTNEKKEPKSITISYPIFENSEGGIIIISKPKTNRRVVIEWT